MFFHDYGPIQFIFVTSLKNLVAYFEMVLYCSKDIRLSGDNDKLHPNMILSSLCGHWYDELPHIVSGARCALSFYFLRVKSLSAKKIISGTIPKRATGLGKEDDFGIFGDEVFLTVLFIVKFYCFCSAYLLTVFLTRELGALIFNNVHFTIDELLDPTENFSL